MLDTGRCLSITIYSSYSIHTYFLPPDHGIVKGTKETGSRGKSNRAIGNKVTHLGMTMDKAKVSERNWGIKQFSQSNYFRIISMRKH